MNQLHATETAIERVRAAQALIKSNRADALNKLNELFREGRVPDPPLHGNYAGELIALDIAPVLTQLTAAITAAWMPWKGKTFDARRSMGDNIFDKSSFLTARVLWPLSRLRRRWRRHVPRLPLPHLRCAGTGRPR